jgi:hypothetical protein
MYKQKGRLKTYLYVHSTHLYLVQEFVNAHMPTETSN